MCIKTRAYAVGYYSIAPTALFAYITLLNDATLAGHTHKQVWRACGRYYMTIVLVHGTYARNWFIRTFRGGRVWWRANSSFCQTLRSKFPECAIVGFEWSGQNSHRARLAAGEELAALLTQLRRNAPQEPLSIIAHSHGGNVALKALDLIEPKTVSSVFLLGMPHMFILCPTPKPCDPLIEGTIHPCGGSTRHWLYWGDAIHRVSQGIWEYHTQTDAVQGFFAQMFTGIPFRIRSRLSGKLVVTRHFLPLGTPGITNEVVDMRSELRVGVLARLIGWDKIKEHNALHSRSIAEMIGNVLATAPAQNAGGSN